MACFPIRPALAAIGGAVLALLVAAFSAAPVQADTIAYLVNVTVRPGYAFASPDEALDYGDAICSALAHGESYTALMDAIKGDFATTDDYQSSYLITQATNELCPALIWRLRNSAAHYQAN